MNAHDPLGEPPSGAPSDEPFAHPERIGSYRILQVIGEGGMGVVYDAEQVEPVRRRVALKMMKLGMDTKEIVARFEAERQALAVMEHPCIAKVLDAGATEAGRPYFVMEYVRGIPLNEYCDLYKLGTVERLRLFIPICQAVQHAHQKGVIHRDLKTSNVLVTEQDGTPVPKIIDFGIAKAISQSLTDTTLVTAYGTAIGTPAYMSPEQAEMSGLDVDTRTDIYSLGAMLYELLSGELPIDPTEYGPQGFILQLVARATDAPTPSARVRTSGNAEFVAALRGTSPSGLQKELKGDLDWIVLKAMEKDRTRRYETANGLAMDIRRHLEHEPVTARPPSRAYRIGKFVRRHRLGVAAAVLIALGLVGGAALATVGMVRATRAERLAAQDAQTAQEVSDFLVGLFEVSDPEEARGNTVTARELLDQGAERISTELAAQPTIRARLTEVIGRVYTELGLYDQAAAALETSVALRDSVQDADSLPLAASLAALGDLYRRRGRLADAEAPLQRSLAIRQHVLGPEDPLVAQSFTEVGGLYFVLGRYDEARGSWERALAVWDATAHPDSERVAVVLSNLGTVNIAQERFDAAGPVLERALQLKERLLGADHPSVATTANNLAALYFELGRYAEAETLYQRARTIYEATLPAEHPRLSAVYLNLAETYVALKRYNDAEPLFERSLAIKAKTLEPNHPSVAMALRSFGNLRRDQGSFREAEDLYRRALAIYEEVRGHTSEDVANTLEEYAELFRRAGRSSEADSLAARAQRILDAADPEKPVP